MVVRIPSGDITNLHYNFVVAKPLVDIYLISPCLLFMIEISILKKFMNMRKFFYDTYLKTW